jgi:hypothetical protein
MKVGDCVQMDYREGHYSDHHCWVGVCTWTDGYKLEFFLDTGEFAVWKLNDLIIAGAEVISESR